MNLAVMADHRHRVRIVVDRDLGALLRALQPAAVLGLVPTRMTVEQQRLGLLVLLDFETCEETALRLFCARLASAPCVMDVRHGPRR